MPVVCIALTPEETPRLGETPWLAHLRVEGDAMATEPLLCTDVRGLATRVFMPMRMRLRAKGSASARANASFVSPMSVGPVSSVGCGRSGEASA